MLVFYRLFSLNLAVVFFLFIVADLHSQNYTSTHSTFTFADAARNNRSIPTEIYYPQDGSPAVAQGIFPVVVLAHGFAMGVDAYDNWGTELAQRGYIVLMPRTEASLFPAPNHSTFAADIQFLCAQILLENNNNNSIFFNKIINSIGLIGHSMGGGSSFLAAANNTNIKTVVGLAPAETNPPASTAAAQVQVPALILSGTRDGVTPPATTHQLIYDNVALSNKKIIVSLIGGAHCYFANTNFACDFGESTSSSNITLSRTDQQQLSYSIVNNWLDYYLKIDCSKLDSLFNFIDNNTLISYEQNGFSAITISVNNNQIVTAQTLNNYHWYQNNTLIANANSPTYSPLSNGNYQLAELDVNNCPLFSNTINFIVNGTFSTQLSNNNDIYYSNNLRQFSSNTINQIIAYQIYNTNGQLVAQNYNTYLNNINTQSLINGVYFIVIHTNTKIYKLSFIIN